MAEDAEPPAKRAKGEEKAEEEQPALPARPSVVRLPGREVNAQRARLWQQLGSNALLFDVTLKASDRDVPCNRCGPLSWFWLRASYAVRMAPVSTPSPGRPPDGRAHACFRAHSGPRVRLTCTCSPAAQAAEPQPKMQHVERSHHCNTHGSFVGTQAPHTACWAMRPCSCEWQSGPMHKPGRPQAPLPSWQHDISILQRTSAWLAHDCAHNAR